MLTLEKTLYAYVRTHTDNKVVKFDNGVGNAHYFLIPKDADKKTYNYDYATIYTLSTLDNYVDDLKCKNKEYRSEHRRV